MAIDFTGWLLDLYANLDGGISLWLLGENGERRRFLQRFSVTFYVAGSLKRLQEVWNYLESSNQVKLSYQHRCRDLFLSDKVNLLAVEVVNPSKQFALFRRLEKKFPDLTYYDVDIPLTIRHAAIYNTFPLAYCQIKADDSGWIKDLKTLDTPWEIEPVIPSLRVLSLALDVHPQRADPQKLIVRTQGKQGEFPLIPARPLLANLRALLFRFNPDVILTDHGDTWLLPRLFMLCRQKHISIPFSRDPQRDFDYHPARSYFSYGRIVYRGKQIRLFGRLHIDRQNTMFWRDYGLEGILETARVTCLPIQGAARLSPGTGISAMQMAQALKDGILVPWHKQQGEVERSASDLLQCDRGGIVYQPSVGLHTDVAELDFVSMYPSIMVCKNISPETSPSRVLGELENEPGLVPRTLSPLLVKRVLLKQRLAKIPDRDSRRKRDKARIVAHKWLLVTCFGYLGYKNARFGQIASHEAVTASSREALFRAKESVEDMGLSVLHMYVDGLWVKEDGGCKPERYQRLLKEISERTGLPIALDGIYRWICFLPSRLDGQVPVGNRYFGVFQDGTIKFRGIEARRKDTPKFIAQAQLEILEYLAVSKDVDYLPESAKEAVEILRVRLSDLYRGKVALEELLVSQRLSRELEAYHVPSPTARAVIQLKQSGKTVHPGERVRFLYVLGTEGVYAWDLPKPPIFKKIDVKRYQELLIRAAETILSPFGLNGPALRLLISDIPAVQQSLKEVDHLGNEPD